MYQSQLYQSQLYQSQLYQSQLYQDLIRELDAQVEKSGLLTEEWINPLAHLALFYAETGNPRKAIQMWEQAGKYSLNPEWLADVSLVMARVYIQAGESEKARASYARVPQYGYGWFTGLAYYDQALPLVNAGKLSEAKAILSRPLQAREQVVDGTVALNAWLASLSYQEGHLEEAMRYSQIAVKENPSRREKMPQYPALRSRTFTPWGATSTIAPEAGKPSPCQTEVKQLVLNIPASSPDRPVYKRFRVKTYGDTTIVAAVGHPAVQVRVVPLIN